MGETKKGEYVQCIVFLYLILVDGQPRIDHGDVAGTAANHWKLYKQDIQLMKNLGVDMYRFSIEWSKVEVS